MSAILPGLRFSVKDKLCKQLRRCRLAAVRLRYLMILNLLSGRSARQTAEVLGVHNTTVYRVARRFREHSEAWFNRPDKRVTLCPMGLGSNSMRNNDLRQKLPRPSVTQL